MTRPKRIRRRRTKGWRMPGNTVYVGRPTRWGNPHHVWHPADKTDRQVAVEMYEDDLLAGRLPFTVDDVRNELRGKNLACWCLPVQPCHADVLLELANPVCQHEGCDSADVVDCWLWSDKAGTHVLEEQYCREHCHEHGYCCCCGFFSAGIESFDLGTDGLCEHCRDQLRAELDEYCLPDEELAMWEDYPGDLLHGWNAAVEAEHGR